MILNQKLKMQEDSDDLAEKWKAQVHGKDEQIQILTEQKDRMHSESEKLRLKCKDLSSDLSSMESELNQIQSKNK